MLAGMAAAHPGALGVVAMMATGRQPALPRRRRQRGMVRMAKGSLVRKEPDGLLNPEPGGSKETDLDQQHGGDQVKRDRPLEPLE